MTLYSEHQFPRRPQSLQPMPPLTAAGNGEGLEEPRELGPAFGWSFSPDGTLVRNSPPIGTPTVTTNGSNATTVSGLTDSQSPNAREKLLRIYTEKDSSHVLTRHDKTNIAEVTKQHVIGRIKFVLPDRKFPSFWQPDLLTNAPPYVDAFFDSYGHRFTNRKVNETVLEQAAELWKAAAPKIKKIVDNHRSGVAQKMKYDIMKGNSFVLCTYLTIKQLII